MVFLSFVSLVSFDRISKGMNPNHPLTRLVFRLKKGGKNREKGRKEGEKRRAKEGKSGEKGRKIACCWMVKGCFYLRIGVEIPIF